MKLMESEDIGILQETVRSIVSEQGFYYIKAVTDDMVVRSPIQQTWDACLRGLFIVIAHPRILDSAMLEVKLNEVFSFLRGPDGTRMRVVVGFVLDMLQGWTGIGSATNPWDVLDLAATVVYKIMGTNTAAMVSSEFKSITERLLEMYQRAEKQGRDPENPQMRHRAAKHLEYLRQRLSIGEALPATGKRKAPAATMKRKTAFVLQRDLPGELSKDGPRHDNDFADISKISILPTNSEIMSLRAEYLPVNDASQLHLPGIRGLIDRHFRLLREDTVGQLRDAVRDEINRRRNPNAGPRDAKHRSQQRISTYEDATVVTANADYNNGLEFLVRCEQPRGFRAAAATGNRKKMDDWWEGSRMLAEGNLVCVIGGGDAAHFFVVARSTARTPKDAKRQQRNDREEEEEQEVGDVEAWGEGEMAQKHAYSLSGAPDYLYVRLQLAMPASQDLRPILAWLQPRGGRQQRAPHCLVEFPGVLLAAFEHTLEAMKRMSQTLDLPFADILAPSLQRGEELLEVPPPRYASGAGFAYNLDGLAKVKGTRLSHRPGEFKTPRHASQVTQQRMLRHTTLDETQSQALIHSLDNGLACIQGPPGTGKSYTGQRIIKGLLDSSGGSGGVQLGPILCVCYTNHALDQLLEHLLDDGIDKVIRLGSQSKSERLKGHGLRDVAQSAVKTKAEKSEQWSIVNAIKASAREVNYAVDEYAQSLSSAALQQHLLQDGQLGHFQEIFGAGGVDEDGFKTVGFDANEAVGKWLARGTAALAVRPPRRTEELEEAPPESLTRRERERLLMQWQRGIQRPLVSMIVSHHATLVEDQARRRAVRQEADLRCLQQAQVVGATTTGLARNIDLLRRLGCRVLICEEAGEVLEAHNLTTLLPSIEHAVLIGDHLQLRPQIQNYSLQSDNPAGGAQYGLDVSLFERLVEPGPGVPRVPFCVLHAQRRMHPSISNLIRQTLYPRLEDGGSVAEYPPVAGMRRRLFWMHHERLEARAEKAAAAAAAEGAADTSGGASHTNDFEVAMVVALAAHLVRQGVYGPRSIAVLTPYLGQLKKLQAALAERWEIEMHDQDLEDLAVADEAETEGRGSKKDAITSSQPRTRVAKANLRHTIRAATVDRFQGDEADVVIVSLVRSNPQQKCGFLQTSNRINVLLSRARHGMFLLGNASTYGNVPMWRRVQGLLREEGNLGPALELQCPRHTDTPMLAAEPDDFLRIAPDGGCARPCDRRLGCGHACTGRCHADQLHQAVRCLEPCPRPKLGCTHACPRPCGDACEEQCSMHLVGVNVLLGCGHVVKNTSCWLAQHPDKIVCKAHVDKKVPGCGHTVRVECHHDVAAPGFRCLATCNAALPCGHDCKKDCHACNVRRTSDGAGDTAAAATATARIVIKATRHGACNIACGRAYTTCSHACASKCHGTEPCKPCERPCDVRCSHSRCAKKCCEPCAPCAEASCASRCPHSQCSMPYVADTFFFFFFWGGVGSWPERHECAQRC
jgi:hypothetical protein